MKSIFQRLYNSEINCGCQSFWDGGWRFWLGDDMNGRDIEERFDTFAEGEAWLESKARETYPESHFAKGLPTWADTRDAARDNKASGHIA